MSRFRKFGIIKCMFLALINRNLTHFDQNNVRSVTCSLAFKSFILLLFRQKQQNQWGPRTRADLAAILSRDVSGKTTPLPGCGARSDERIALRTTEHLKALVSTRLLHAALVLAQTGGPRKTLFPEIFQFNHNSRCSTQKSNRTLCPGPPLAKK